MSAVMVNVRVLPATTDDLVKLVVDLLGIGREDVLVNMAARRLEHKLIRMSRTERMLERMIELTLASENCSTDMLFDFSMQYHGIRRMLVREGVLEKDAKYDLDDLGLIHAGVYS